MDFLKLMQERYTTKHYDKTKVVPDEILEKILECARLTPTSTNTQPYHFFVVSGEAKARLLDGIMDFNQPRYSDASHAIVIASYKTLDEPHLAKVLEAEKRDGRLPNEEIAAASDQSRHFFNGIHMQNNDYVAWSGKQSYIAFASIVYAAQAYGVDSTALEGIDYAKLDELLGLAARNLTTQVVICLGYRSPEDSNTLDKRAKSRLNKEDLFTILK